MLRCCGAPAEWAGRTDLFEEVRAGFMADYQALGSPQVILACSSCYRIFKEYLPDVACISLLDLFDAHGC
jgi:Fe-S oxidoreductase